MTTKKEVEKIVSTFAGLEVDFSSLDYGDEKDIESKKSKLKNLIKLINEKKEEMKG